VVRERRWYRIYGFNRGFPSAALPSKHIHLQQQRAFAKSCIQNMIRQFTWRHLYSEEDMPPDIATPLAGRMHVDHCIETLRLSLMCYADVTPLLIYVDPNAPIGYRADFNIHHKCRDFDKLVEYVDNQPQVSIASKSNFSQLQLHDDSHHMGKA